MSDSLIYLPVIKSTGLLYDILEKARLCNKRAYLIITFLSFTGLKLCEILNLTVDSVQGDYFYIDKYERLLIYSELFKTELDDFINNSCKSQGYLFHCANKDDEPLVESGATILIKNFLKNIGYKGTSQTFSRTFYYLYLNNYGSLEPIGGKKVWQRRWLECKLCIPFDEYKGLLDSLSVFPVQDDIINLCAYFSEHYISKAKDILNDTNSPYEVKQSVKKQLLELYRHYFRFVQFIDATLLK